MPIATRRIYDPPTPEDGYRLLIMRRWPRGISRSRVDAWEPEMGPSLPLLGDWRQGRIDWDTYTRRYTAEMASKPELLASLRQRARQETVTLLCGCQDEARCHRTLLAGLVAEE